MSLVSEIREDLRIARVNNPSYAMLFAAFNAFAVLFKIALLACFALGIWYLLYSEPNRPVDIKRLPLPVASDQHVIGQEKIDALTPERIAFLRALADNAAGIETAAAAEPAQAAADSNVSESIIPLLPSDTGVEVFSVKSESDPVPFVATDDTVAVGQTSADQREASVAQQEPAEFQPVGVPDSEVADLAEVVVIEAIAKASVDPGPAIAEVASLTAPAFRQASGQSAVAVQPLPAPREVQFDEQVEGEPVTPADTVLSSSTQERVEPAVDSAQSTPTPLLAADLDDRDGEWLLAQPEESYLIQIGSTANRPFLVNFARQFTDTDHPTALYLFRLRRAERNEYGLSVGIFPDQLTAEAALEAMSDKARRYGAYVRDVKSVQQQIRDVNIAISMSRDLPESE
ncbi:hypothetical protein AB833_10285 [Chromatiales bacterium (ex Bugula neritina AB1)]|nr:hypothetical protein AB833_10285 [Chromatiales bacterium (ex Bugula neritina AB1)]